MSREKIETNRLVIRRMEERDFESYFMLSLEQIPAVLISEFGEDEYRKNIFEVIRSTKDEFYSVFLKENLAYCGYVVLQHTSEIPEIGIAILKAYQAQGIGTESTIAFLNFLCEEYHIEQIDAKISPDNVASIHLVEKIGAEQVSNEMLFNIMEKCKISLDNIHLPKVLRYRLTLPINQNKVI